MHDIFYNNEEDFYREDEYVHRSLLPDQDQVHDFVNGILESVYTTGDTDKLENCLEELCDLLGVEFKLGNCALEKKKDLMQWHLKQQREQINTLKGNQNG